MVSTASLVTYKSKEQAELNTNPAVHVYSVVKKSMETKETNEPSSWYRASRTSPANPAVAEPIFLHRI